MKQFEFTTSHASSILVMLLLFIFVFQPFTYETMIHSFLGRVTLLFILILITSCNVMIGLIWLLIIVSLYEYYSRFEGAENMVEVPVPTPELKPDAYDNGSKSTPEVLPTDMNSGSVPDLNVNSDSVDQATKLEKERQVQKGEASKTLPVSKTMDNSENVLPSESTTTSDLATKQGFANMFGYGHTIF
jgi:hypothetical protein